ncbi:MAG: hypothetical protein M1825_006171 [Sarcosagium campestre]|nr:MAG: hypothetical protein M1825_006171 [Sarcosagium campestre]
MSDKVLKIETTTRRVRALFNGVYVADTTEARHVWEHPYYPQFYVPKEALKPGTLKTGKAVDGPYGALRATLSVGTKSTDRVVCFEKGDLAGLVKIDFAAVDAWFEEDQEIYVHPKDPMVNFTYAFIIRRQRRYKRVDILPSSRLITVAIDGVTIAESRASMFLLETTLPTRYYLPKIAFNWDLLASSRTTSRCPYKGEANYYDVRINGKIYQDILWWYRYPTSESISIAGRIAPYNEKVDISIDGVPQKRPKTKFG